MMKAARKTAVLIDFDDTIFNTTAFKASYREFCQENNREFLRVADALAPIHNDSAPPFAPTKHLSPAMWRVHQKYIRAVSSKFVYSDARAFLQKLDTTQFQPIIFSFGDPDFQREKIRAAGLTLPIIIIDHRNKSETIQAWFHTDSYQIEDEQFSKIILIDDRERSFSGFEQLSHAHGFLLKRDKNSAISTHPCANVETVHSFRTIEQLLRTNTPRSSSENREEPTPPIQ